MAQVPTRDSFGRFLPGQTGNPEGRLPRQTETKYLEVTMAEVTPERWAEAIRIAIDDATDLEVSAHVRARAREWLAKYLIGEPSQLHQLLYKEERKFEIHVIFGDNGDQKALPEVVDVEPIIIHED
jgi:hypothetical protein